VFCSECGTALGESSRSCPRCGASISDEPARGAEQSGPAPHPATRRLPLRVVTAIAGVAALVAVGALLVRGLGGTSGADSPTAAVRQLAAAAEAGDPAAAIAMIDPGETQGLSAAYSKVRDAMKASGGLHANGTIAGAAVKFEELRLSEQRLGPDVAKVIITGGTLKAAGTLKPLYWPAGGPASSTVDLASARGPSGPDSPGAGLFLVTRKHEGRWYVSPAMTALQYLVDTRGLPEPDFSKSGASVSTGQQTSNPERLASALAQAVSDNDVEALIGLMPEEEASALRPYSAALQQLVSQDGGSLQLQFNNPQLTETPIGGGLERLNIGHLGFAASVSREEEFEGEGGSSTSGAINGPCWEAVSNYGKRSHGCFGQIHQVLGVSDLFVVARRESGGLRLAPIATLLTYVRMAVERIGGSGVRRLFGAIAHEAPAGTLTAGVRASGHLNDAGYTMLAYHAQSPGLLAVDSNQDAVVLKQDGDEAQRLACPDGSELYQLGSAGSYRVLVGAGDYRPESYWVLAEPVHPQNASVPSQVSGTIGNGARLTVLSVDVPSEGASFQTRSPVLSTFTGPLGESEDSCYAPSVTTILGPEALLHPSEVHLASYPSADEGSSSTYGSDQHSYLAISGSPEAKFSGELTAGESDELSAGSFYQGG
jgi:hypothetical protein